MTAGTFRIGTTSRCLPASRRAMTTGGSTSRCYSETGGASRRRRAARGRRAPAPPRPAAGARPTRRRRKGSRLSRLQPLELRRRVGLAATAGRSSIELWVGDEGRRRRGRVTRFEGCAGTSRARDRDASKFSEEDYSRLARPSGSALADARFTTTWNDTHRELTRYTPTATHRCALPSPLTEPARPPYGRSRFPRRAGEPPTVSRG